MLSRVFPFKGLTWFTENPSKKDKRHICISKVLSNRALCSLNKEESPVTNIFMHNSTIDIFLSFIYM